MTTADDAGSPPAEPTTRRDLDCDGGLETQLGKVAGCRPAVSLPGRGNLRPGDGSCDRDSRDFSWAQSAVAWWRL